VRHGFEGEPLAFGFIGLGEINEGKLQLCNGLPLEQRPAFPEQPSVNSRYPMAPSENTS